MIALAATTFVVYSAIVLPLAFLFWLAWGGPAARAHYELASGVSLAPSRTPVLDFFGLYLVVLAFVFIAN